MVLCPLKLDRALPRLRKEEEHVPLCSLCPLCPLCPLCYLLTYSTYSMALLTCRCSSTAGYSSSPRASSTPSATAASPPQTSAPRLISTPSSERPTPARSCGPWARSACHSSRGVPPPPPTRGRHPWSLKPHPRRHPRPRLGLRPRPRRRGQALRRRNSPPPQSAGLFLQTVQLSRL